MINTKTETIGQLERRESFNFALFQHSPVHTVIVDLQGRVVKSNIAKRRSGDRIPKIGDLMYLDYAAHHEIDMRKHLMKCIEHGGSVRFPELKYKNKFIAVTINAFESGAIIISQDITEQKIAEQDRINLINDLRRALTEIETLRGLLPICACCKKIRDDNGYWNHIEVYISKHTLADFTHTMCPECLKQSYPEFYQRMETRSQKTTPSR
jgi:hypothetical protein